MSGPREIRPREVFRPTRPVHAAGILIEPPPSLPCAIGTTPHAPGGAPPPARPAAGRAARRARCVPRVSGRPGGARLGGREDPELGQVGWPDDDEPRVAQ